MDDKRFLENALAAWKRHHQMTYSLLDQLTDEQLYHELPRPGLNMYAKHFEEMAEVQNDYARAFHTHILKFTEGSVYAGESSRAQLHAAFEAADTAVHAGIAACPPEQPIDIFGVPGTRADLVQTLLHHELFHHGQFSVFSYEMAFNLPKDWRDFWWIPARY
ncbi:MAG TPA: DinB family protein [Anaerolineales bacterium]|nr:DinB family protein [Anaerolineales bacterium]